MNTEITTTENHGLPEKKGRKTWSAKLAPETVDSLKEVLTAGGFADADAGIAAMLATYREQAAEAEDPERAKTVKRVRNLCDDLIKVIAMEYDSRKTLVDDVERACEKKLEVAQAQIRALAETNAELNAKLTRQQELIDKLTREKEEAIKARDEAQQITAMLTDIKKAIARKQ